jgi:hypothetical protein
MADTYATFELAGKWNKFPHCFKPCAPAELKALLKGTLQGSGCESIGRPGGCRVTPPAPRSAERIKGFRFYCRNCRHYGEAATEGINRGWYGRF